MVLDNKTKLEKLDENFWNHLKDDKKEFLRKEIAPIMRTRTGEDFKAMSFELDIEKLSIARLASEDDEKSEKKIEALEEVIIEKISDLPLSVNTVSKEQELVESVLYSGYVQKAGDTELDALVDRLAPLMKYREDGIKPDQDTLDLKDVTVEKGYIEFGPQNERVTIVKYREKIEELIKRLEEENEILKRVKRGEKLTSDDVEELANTLLQYDPYPTESNLQKAYDARQVSFLDLIKHIMGLGDLVTFSDKVSEAFAEFIAYHNTLTAKQIQFLQTLQTFIIDNGKLEKKDLIKDPFTRIHRLGIRGLFKPQEQEEILEFTSNLLVHA